MLRLPAEERQQLLPYLSIRVLLVHEPKQGIEPWTLRLQGGRSDL